MLVLLKVTSAQNYPCSGQKPIVSLEITLDEGWDLAEGVSRILRPLGMKHCYKIYKTSHNLEERRRAVWLLKYTSDTRCSSF
jgi:hypothetical protein